MKKKKLGFLALFVVVFGLFCAHVVCAQYYGPQGVQDNASLQRQMGAQPSESKGCQPITEKLDELHTCLLCDMFEVILRTDQTMATKSFSALASSFRNLIIVVMALFIAYKTLMTVSALTKQDVGKYLGEILVQAFKVLLAALLLTKSIYIYHYVINPLMEAALEFGLVIIDNDVLTGLNKYSAEYVSKMPDGVISKNLLAQVLGTVRLFSESAAELPAIGSSLMCHSIHDAGKELMSIRLPNFPMFISGLLCWSFGWAITLACCFYLLDSVVRFGIFCTLVPFLIACWPFKVTIGYTSKGWEIFMNAFFNFVMMGVVITMTSELVCQALIGDSSIDISKVKQGQEGAFEEIAALSGKDQILAAMNSNNMDALSQLMALDGVKFLVLLACCIFAFKLTGQINDLAQDISGASGGEGIGNKIGGLAAQGAKRAVGTATHIGGRVTGLSGVAQGIKAKADQFNNRIAHRIAGGKNPSNSNRNQNNNQNNNQNQNQNQPDANQVDETSGAGGGWSDDTSAWD